MFIVNSEGFFLVYNVEEGWDWIRIFGVIIMFLIFEEMWVKKVRYFSLRLFVGGVIFKGLEVLLNGVFGMDFY